MTSLTTDPDLQQRRLEAQRERLDELRGYL
jgi:hypothetical protein